MIVVLAFVGPSTNLWVIRLVVFVAGMGMAGVFIPSQAASFATISKERTGAASTLFNAQRQLGGAIGVALLTTVLVAVKPVHLVGGHPVLHIVAYHVSFLAAAAIALCAAGAAFTVRDQDAASTMAPRPSKASSAATDEVEPIGRTTPVGG
jgi:MFS family permease